MQIQIAGEMRHCTENPEKNGPRVFKSAWLYVPPVTGRPELRELQIPEGTNGLFDTCKRMFKQDVVCSVDMMTYAGDKGARTSLKLLSVVAAPKV